MPHPAAEHYDAVVVGSGPAGSAAALALARGGARVALVDKARFPRDKACGDLIGPRGVQALTEFGIDLPGPRLGDMEVVGPTGRAALLPAKEGATYPGHAIVASRLRFDDRLRQEAVDAGAAPFTGRADAACFDSNDRLTGFEIVVAGGRPLRLTADVVIGADGALTRVGAAAGLVDDRRVLWGFAVRGYLPAEVALPRIHFWEPSKWSGYPGYGWVFPGEDGAANVGLGVGALGDRRSAARAVRELPLFLQDVGLNPSELGPTLGGWLKMGMVGTVPASGRTLLVGDAAGLVNPLQGEGIAQALRSGQAAAAAVLKAGPAGAARLYREDLSRWYAPYASTTAPVTGWMLQRPRAVACIGRILTARGVSTVVSGGWAIYWNHLLDGAAPGWSARVARLADRGGAVLTSRSSARKQLRRNLGGLTGPATGDGTR